MWPGAAATPLAGMGCMRLSTDPARDDERSIAVIHAALDAGVTILDTADAYCLHDGETGHNERTIARALATWPRDRGAIHIATKGGLTRPKGEWIPDGRAKHVAAACEASCRALNVNRIDLYQLHVPDPRVPFTTSVRALASLKKNGVIAHAGLCNVTVGQIETARRIVDIAAVQVEISVWNDSNILSGVVDYCTRNGIRVMASRPLGGPARARKAQSDKRLSAIASTHHTTPCAIALAWLTHESPAILPIPGATRIETATANARASAIVLTDDECAALGARSAEASRSSRDSPGGTGPGIDPPGGRGPGIDNEVVLVMGLPAAGKSTIARALVDQGYTRLNRDDQGGSLQDLLPGLRHAIEGGASRIVLDNTYVSRKARAAVLRSLAPTGTAARCVWLNTGIEDAQVNAAWRMVERYGRLLDPAEMRQAVKHDPGAFGPGVQFRYQRDLEPPDVSEGFSRVDVVPFARALDPSFDNRALIVWCDGVLTDRPDRDAVLRRHAAEGWRVLGLGWRDGLDDEVYARLRERVGVPFDIRYCPHGGGPPVCWCRKPLPGLAVVFIQQYRLNPARCVYVGRGPQDRGFARRLGFEYRDEAEFFAC